MQKTKAASSSTGRTPREGPGRPRKLHRDAVVQAAEELIRKGGGAARLTMRSLSERLGVTAPTLYTYFGHLDEIEAAALDRIAGSLPLPDLKSPVPMMDQLIELFVAVRALQIRNPEILWGKVGSTSWGWAIRRANHLFKTFSALGANRARAILAYRVLVGVTTTSAVPDQDASPKAVAQRRQLIDSMRPSEVDFIKPLYEELPLMALPSEAGFREVLRALIEIHLPEVLERDAALRKSARPQL